MAMFGGQPNWVCKVKGGFKTEVNIVVAEIPVVGKGFFDAV